jgi:hypothetical protein
MAAIARVYTLNLVAEMLGESEDRLADVLLDLEPEDGVIWIYDVGDRQCQALTDFGIENLRSTLDEHKKNSADQNKARTSRS